MLLFSMSGCSLLTSKEDFSIEINALLMQQNYGKALSKVKHKMISDPKYSVLHEQVIAEAKLYEKKIIDKSRSELKQDKLYQAFKILESALDNSPQSEVLNDELALVLNQRDALIQVNKDKQMLSYGQYLAKSLEGHEQLAIWRDSSIDLAQDYSHIHQEAKEVAPYLMSRGKKKENQVSFQDQEITKYFTLAVKLSDDESIKAAHQAFSLRRSVAKAQLKESRNKSLRLQTQQKAKQVNKNALICKQYIKKNNFIAAKKMLDSHVFSTNAPVNKDLKALYVSALNREVQKSYRKGAQYYSKEQYQLALNAWTETLALNPKHELTRKNVIRTTHILNKLKKLQERADKKN